MKTPSLVLLLLGLTISTAHAQVSQEWVARYASATPYSDIPYAMTVDAAGHVYVTGTAATAGTNDWATIKYNSAGEQEWLRPLNGGGSDAAVAITTDEAGNVQPTRAALVTERGESKTVPPVTAVLAGHFNAITSWATNPNGEVSHVYA